MDWLDILSKILLLASICLSIALVIINTRNHYELERREFQLENVQAVLRDDTIKLRTIAEENELARRKLVSVIGALASLDSVKEYNFGIADLEQFAAQYGLDIYHLGESGNETQK